MHDDEIDARFERLADDTFEAAIANQTFLAAIVVGMVRGGLLPLPLITDALAAQQDVIERHRQEGFDQRLSALALERLAAQLRRNFDVPPDVRSLLDEWRLDPADPTWPHLPDNDP